MRPFHTRGVHGFSLIELIAILVIIGALAVFVAPRLNITGFSQYSFHERLLSAVRHAQKTATASRCEISFEIDAADDKYSATFNGSGPPECPGEDTALIAPGGSWDIASSGSGDLAGKAPEGVDIANGPTITFDGFGVPASAATISFASGRQVVVEARTGYVHD